MTSQEVKEKFLNFFAKKKHKILSGSSLVPDDPTLLLTAAGMVQFKPIFLGEKKVDFRRAATAQKCVRTSDIENVGHTARHLTFFEMLGNFSFGDYYKEEAIQWGWEFLTKDLKLSKKKLWITIFKDDDESFLVWRDKVGIEEERIVRLGEEDNFWSAGDTGPCGPCTEMVYDLGKEHGCGKKTCDIHCGCDRWLEVWNLVFMQYNRDEKGKLEPLKRKGVDTGLGLERAASILQGVPNNFETDLMKPVLNKVASLAGIEYKQDTKKDVSLKIVTDHMRAITFMISDGVLPSNEGRGYILRRLLRRAVRHGRLLGIEKTFLPEVADKVVKVMRDGYPELEENLDFVGQIVRSEEERFTQTLKSGLLVLSEVVKKAKQKKTLKLSGDIAFQLYDTYGFPLELTQEIAQESGLEVDLKSFEKLMERQRAKARLSWTGKKHELDEVYAEVFDYAGGTRFIGYSTDAAEASVKAIVKRGVAVKEAKKGEQVEIVLDETPFYAEMGGQVSDQGTIEAKEGRLEVIDTQTFLGEMFLHKGKMAQGLIKIGDKVKAEVDIKRRQEICKNHTATHLLHWALRLVLGKHVKQAGSLVDEGRFRFDFTHFANLKSEEILKVERLVNDKILEAHPVRCYTTSFDFAKQSGAIALFGEKYSDFVRVVEAGNFSKELCGGTHIDNTSKIGLFKIVSEGSIGANLRRIEGCTSYSALNYVCQEEQQLGEVTSLLKTKKDEVANKLVHFLSDYKEKEKEMESLRSQALNRKVKEALKLKKNVGKYKIIVNPTTTQDMETLRNLNDILHQKAATAVTVSGATTANEALIVAKANEAAIKAGFSANNLLREIAPLIGGGGGGRADMAQAGGKKKEKLGEALKEVDRHLERVLGTRNKNG